MAAQPLVRASYLNPVETYSTNVMGTVHVLEAARHVGTAKAIVNITSDKCYENKEWIWGYRENESMGGYDPYSNSKGCSELVTSAYRHSYFEGSGIHIATARAGNVIGGGDWATDRLVPDILRAFEKSKRVVIRNPLAVRPWQHVLEPLSGYLLLAEHLYEYGHPFTGGWNFGPNENDAQSVKWMVDQLAIQWGINTSWMHDESPHLHEATQLKLDISKAKAKLGWQPRWNLSEAIKSVAEWHKHWLTHREARSKCLDQIIGYQNQIK
jgi:CDP-glucose 4,6-dehydratase